MKKVPRLQQITDYIKAIDVQVETRFSDFLIINYAQLDLRHVNWLPAYRPGYFEINLDLTAGCSIRVDEFQLTGVANRLTLISPQRLLVSMPTHTTITDHVFNHGFKGYSIFFNADFIQADIHNNNFLSAFPFFNPMKTPSLSLNDRETGQFIDIFNKIQYEYDNDAVFSKDIIKSYLNILFLKAKQYYHHTQAPVAVSRELEIYRTYESLVQNHFLDYSSVKEFAGKLHITPKHLSETVKKVSGESALELIHKAQLGYAKTQLLQTGKTVSQIAAELNFDNSDYFSVFFKRLTGKSPLQYRVS